MQGAPLQEAGWDSGRLPGVPLRMDGLVRGERRYVIGRNISVGSFPTSKLWSAPHIHQAGGSPGCGASGVSIVPGTVCPAVSHFLRVC